MSQVSLRLSVIAAFSFAASSAAQKAEDPKERPFGSIVRCVAVSRDGAFAAAALGERKERGLVALWNMAEQKQIWSHSEASGVPAVAFSPDGRTLAIGAYDHKAKLLDRGTGRVLMTLEGHTNYVGAVAFSPDGKMLATGGWDQTIRFWDVATGEEKQSLAWPEDRIYSVSFSPSGQWLLAAGNAARIWDVATGNEKRNVAPYGRAAVFVDDAQFLTNHGGIRLWAVATEEESRVIRSYVGNRIAYSPKARLLAATTENKIVLYDFTVDPPSPQQKERIRALMDLLDDDSYAIREKAGKDLLAVGFVAEPELRRRMTESISAEVRIRSRRLRDELLRQSRAKLYGHTAQIESFSFTEDGRVLVSGSSDGTVRFWSIGDIKETARWTPTSTR